MLNDKNLFDGRDVPTGGNIEQRKKFMETVEEFVREVVMPKVEGEVKEVQEQRVQHPTQIDPGMYLYQPEINRVPNLEENSRFRPNNDQLVRKLQGEIEYRGNQPDGGLNYRSSASRLGQGPKNNQSLYNPIHDKSLLSNSSPLETAQRRSNSRSKLDSLIDDLNNEGGQGPHKNTHQSGIQYRRPPKGMPDPLLHPEKVSQFEPAFSDSTICEYD